MRDQSEREEAVIEVPKVEVLLRYHEVEWEGMVLPREDRLWARPGWWCLQDNYCIRSRKLEDQRSEDTRRPMHGFPKMRR